MRIRKIQKIVGIVCVTLLVILIIGFLLAHLVVPGYVDSLYNTFAIPGPHRVSPSARELHDQLEIVDLHADSLIWGRNLSDRNTVGHLDLPRLLEANVAIQVFSVPTKVPRKRSQWGTSPESLNLITLSAIGQLWSPPAWFRLDHRAVYLGNELQALADRSGEEFRVIESARELEDYLSNRKSGQTSGLLAIEGLHALEGDLGNLDEFFRVGYRVMGLVHHFDNEVGGSSYGLGRGGLTAFGEKVIRRIEELGMIVDLAHASPQLMEDVIRVARRPLLISHTGVRGTCDRTRNLSDRYLERVAENDGVVGIGFWSGATCGEGAPAVARAIRYTADLVGVEHVALGSDFDGDSMPFDVTGLPLITEALQAEGFSVNEIKRIMGGNSVIFLRENLP